MAAGRPIGIGAKLKPEPSLDLDRSYPMTQPNLGHVVIINNLRSKVPDTAGDVLALKAALETAGFSVRCYDDCNKQDMIKIKNWAVNQEVHEFTNSFGVIVLCKKINQGWIVDRYQRRVFTIEQLANGLSGVKTLHQKPKFIVIQESEDASDAGWEEIEVLDDKEDFYIISTSSPGYIRELAAMLEQNYMEEPLGTIFLMTKQNVTKPQQVSPEVKESELMTLAGKISSAAMQIIAVQKLGFSISEVETLESVTRENQWMMKFKLLDRWKNKNRRNSRQKLAGLLREASSGEGFVDPNMVDKVLKTGNAGDALVREFDSFTHVLHFSEFYKRRPHQHYGFGRCIQLPLLIAVLVALKALLWSIWEMIRLVIRVLDSIQAKLLLYKLKLFSTHDTYVDRWCSGFTVMPQSGHVVVSGSGFNYSPWFLLVFSLKKGKLNRKKINSVCCHESQEFVLLSPLIIDGREKLVVSCYMCGDLKLLDLQTGGWSTAFKDCRPRALCSGGTDIIFVQSFKDGSILLLDASSSVFKGPVKILHTDRECWAMCYIPPPVNALVLIDRKSSKMVSLSVEKDEETCQFENNLRFPSLLFHSEHNVLLIADWEKKRALIVNPGMGGLIQIIDLPDMDVILAMGLYKDQIVMLHPTNGRKISYFNLFG